MQRTTLVLLVTLLIAIGAAVSLFMVVSKRDANGAHTGATSTPSSLSGRSIFTDGEYGFSIQYPQEDQTDYAFTSFYHLPANWRVDALSIGTGTPLIAIIGKRVESNNSYPRYFSAEVRIGATKDPIEVARCTSLSASGGEQALPDVTLGGTTFKAFAFQSAGMMQYLKGTSYRTLRNGTCIAIEQLETGSSYGDDPKSAADIPQATLDASYAALDSIVKSFAFSQP